MNKLFIHKMSPEDITPNTLVMLATSAPLVAVESDWEKEERLYRLRYTENNGANCIVLCLESSRDKAGRYWVNSFISPDSYGKSFRIVKIISDSEATF